MTSASFREFAQRESSGWFQFSRMAWMNSAQLPQLEPSRLYDDPITYNDNVHRWFDERYSGEFKSIFSCVNSVLRSNDIVTEEFIDIWNIYFDPWSLWKQLIPFFAFSTALGGLPSETVRVTAAYVIGQGVPSAAVDKLLDTPKETVSGQVREWLTPFCLVAYSTALELMRSSDVPSRVEDAFLHYTRLMHAYMWKESTERFRYPMRIADGHLRDYVHGQSRILSSVFYSITIAWAFALAGKELDDNGKKACISLRRVRQLNDEIIDTEEDFKNGILTYPILHSLFSARHGGRMRRILDGAWHTGQVPAEVPADLVAEFHHTLLDSGSFPAAANESLSQLLNAAGFIMGFFEPADAFEVSLIVNQRLSTLLKRAANGWRHVPDRYTARIASNQTAGARIQGQCDIRPGANDEDS
jgi:hypothetical protein